MRPIVMLMIASLAIAPVLADPPDGVVVRDLGEGRYELRVILAQTADPAHGQLAISPRANEFCGTRQPQFGKYRFESRAPSAGSPGTSAPASLKFTQQIECVDELRAPPPGRFAAADYRARYDGQAFYCGYVVWLRQHDGGYLILREEEGQATPDIVATVAPEQLSAFRAQLGCRD